MAGSLARAKHWRRSIALPLWTAQAWGAIGITALFLGISCWWLTQDHSIPVFDAGRHLSFTFYILEELEAGHFTHALTLSFPYPPFAYLVGDLGVLVGGIDVAPPILAENFVFVPLLALGCYHVGCMAFDRTAGLLAVVFALGSPLIAAQFHVFMTDAPETAMVAVSLWATLASDGFTRVGISAAAGLAVGVGMLTKEPFVFFAAGPVAVTVIRGRLKAWPGLLAFVLVAAAIALPWYLHEYAQVKGLGTSAVSEAGSKVRSSGITPPALSLENFEWYFWNMANNQLYAPLLAFSIVGWLWAMWGFVRRRVVGHFIPELAIGAFLAWLAITETYFHDTRYSMPLLVYLAVFGVGWITRAPKVIRAAAASALVLIAVANTAGSTFGVGSTVDVNALHLDKDVINAPGFVTFYSSAGFLVSGPQQDGDILATLRALRRNGVRAMVLQPSTVGNASFSAAGMFALDGIAKLGTIMSSRVSAERLTPEYAVLANGPIEKGEAPPCLRLDNGTGVWIRLGDPELPGARDYCPSRRPSFYG